MILHETRTKQDDQSVCRHADAKRITMVLSDAHKRTAFALMRRDLSAFLVNTHMFTGWMHMQNIDELKEPKDDSTTDDEQDDF